MKNLLLIVINKNRQQWKKKDSAGFNTSERAAALEQQPTLAEPSQDIFSAGGIFSLAEDSRRLS